jgi:hypothetical protein
MNLSEEGAGLTHPVGSTTGSNLSGIAPSGRSIGLSFLTSITFNLLFMLSQEVIGSKWQMVTFRPTATHENHLPVMIATHIKGLTKTIDSSREADAAREVGLCLH